MIEQVLVAAVSALVYSFVFYAKKRAGDDMEEFKPFKLGATLIVGVLVGISYSLAGVEFGQGMIAEQLVAYTGTIALVESALKFIWRQFLKDLVNSV